MVVCRGLFAALLLYAGTAIAAPPIAPGEGRPQVLWQETRGLVGQTAYVSGKVVDVNTLNSGITFINFDDQRPARFVAVIFKENLGNFPRPPAETYKGKIVRIYGTVSLFKNNPQIVVSKPDQIEILDALPASSIPKPRPIQQAKPGEIVVASYNLLNLFDDVDDPYRDDEGTPAKPRRQMELAAKSIQALNADVLAVEEVENRDYLQRFVDVFLPTMGYEHVVLFEGNDRRGIDVGLLSRVPIGDVTSHRHLAFPGPHTPKQRFNRDLLAATIVPPVGEPFEVWVVHLKSNAGGREEAEPIRLAEAREVRRLLDRELMQDSNARIIVTGDFNDTPQSQTLTTIVGASTGALWSVNSEIADPSVVTYNEGEYRSVIDFILCTPAMRARYVPGSLRIPQGSIATTGSDHNPISATFQLK
jgi:endonuclease/exonuclease/phosphatase family metal-dependent hydrolase